MNKNILTLITAVSLFVTTALASAQETKEGKIYLQAEGGLSVPANKPNRGYYPNNKFKNSSMFGIGLGYYLTNNLRTDITVNYRPNFKYTGNLSILETADDITYNHTYKQKSNALTAMLNLTYDLITFNNFTPYLGFGVGAARLKSGNYYIITDNNIGTYTIAGKTSTNFAYQVGAGTAFQLKNDLSMNLGYRFVNLGNLKTKSGLTLPDGSFAGIAPVKTKFKNHEIYLGFKIDL